MREVIRILLRVKAVTLRVNPPFKWVSGILAPIYTDNRLLMTHHKERNEIVNHFLEEMDKHNLKPDVIAGIAVSGIPWAAWIAHKAQLPMVYIRKGKKEYGKENLIEGHLKKGQKVVLIEDLISTGASSLNGVKAVKAAGCKVIANMAIFTYELEESKKNFEKEHVKLITLTNISDLTEVALAEKYINAKEKKQILAWRKNPAGWGKCH